MSNLLLFAIIAKIAVRFENRTGISIRNAIIWTLMQLKRQVLQTRFVVWFGQSFVWGQCHKGAGVDEAEQLVEENSLVMEDEEIDNQENDRELLNAVEDTDNEEEHPISFTVHLQLTFIKLLKTVYTPITDISFQLIYCISINSSNR